MKPLSEPELTTGTKILIQNGDYYISDTISSKSSNGIYAVINHGLGFAEGVTVYLDTPATRAWLLLQKERVQ